MDKRWVMLGAVFVGIFLFVIFLVPFFVNADTFRPTIESQLSAALVREVTLGKLSFSVIEGSLTAEDIAIADDPEFSKVPFIQAKKLAVGVEMLPFLFRKQVRITKLIIDTPSIQLIEHANGRWNYSSLGGTSINAGTQQQASASPDMSVDELRITNGSAMVSTIPVTTKPFEYSDVNLTVKQFSFSKSFPFDLSAKLPAQGALKLTGDAGPISQKDASKSPFRANLELRGFDPVAAGVIEPGKGISVDSDVDAQIASDGTNVSSTGKITASRLLLAQRGSPTQQPVEMDFTISQNLDTRQGAVSDIAIHAEPVAAHVNGGFQFTPQSLTLNLRLSAPGLPIDQLERLLPAVGIHLPGGSSLQGGTLTASIAITGPVTAATWTGPVEIDNTKLAGFDLGSRIEGMKALGGTGSGTQIQVLKANVNSSSETTRITDIYGDFPQIGSATGAGTVAPTGELDFQLTAKFSSTNAVGATARGVPLTITGSATSPSIRANMGASLR